MNAKSKARRPGRIVIALFVLLVLPSVIAGLLYALQAGGPAKPTTARTKPAVKPPTREQRIDSLRQQADVAAREAARVRVAEVVAFFKSRKDRAPAFAKEATSFDAGWLLVQSQLGIEDKNKHAEYLRAAFEKTVFSPKDLEKVLESTTEGFKADLAQIDNQFLIDLRADLANDPSVPTALASSLQSDEAFRAAYRATAEKVLPLLLEDLAGSAVVEVASFYLGNLAAQGLVQAGRHMMGTSGGFWGQAVAGAVTIAAGVVVDYVLKYVLEQLGYSPTDKIAKAVANAIDGLRDQVIDGAPGAAAKFQTLTQTYEAAITSEDRAKCREEFEAFAGSGGLGLAKQFDLLCEAQASLHRQVTQSVLSGPK